MIRQRLQQWREDLADRLQTGAAARVAGVVLAVYLLITIVIGMLWSAAPEPFDVAAEASALAARNGQSVVVGAATTTAAIRVVETLLEKRGGLLSNDIAPPGVWLDNMPNWEYGALIQSRDMVRALRESFSRSQSQSREDVDLGKAEPRLNFSNNSWIVPSSESEYRGAVSYLYAYLERLSDASEEQSQFYARADNLRYWLSMVETRLGSLSQRLSASVGKRQINIDLAGEAPARQSTSASVEMAVKTPWLEIDDVFYEARGATWALLHFLKAAEIDFEDVLKDKNALVSMQQIIRELEGTQQALYSPIILNGSGFGVLANHSLVMTSYISRANAAIIDLRELLSRG